MESGTKQLQAKINDLIRLSEKYKSERFSDFLTEEEQADIYDFAKSAQSDFYGGYPNAARKVFGVFPDWEDVEFSEYPIKIIRITKKYKKELTHRDYLGTVLSLGIERSKVGDILTDDDGAYVFVKDNVSDFLVSGIEKIANCGVKTELVELSQVELPQQQYDDLFAVCASMRLDAIVGAVTNTSRSKAAGIIKAAKVSVNHKATEECAKVLKIGDVLSVRGFGRYIIESENGRTGSGRLHVHIKKFR